MHKRLILWILGISAITGFVFLLAGSWRDPWLWAYVAMWAATTLYAIVPADDDLLRERFHPPNQGADRVALGFVRALGLGHIVIGALDAGRWHLTPVPTGLRAAALLTMGATVGIFYRAMHENRFFSAVVRVQRERGHRVVDSGPYSIVRHPGYAGLMLAMPCSGLALGSFLAAAIGLLLSALVIRRVMLEDAFLRNNLEGYAAYATRVQHRLVPRVW